MTRRFGFLRDTYPHYRFGSGPDPLVVMTGLSDAFHPARSSCVASVFLKRYYYRSFTDSHTVHVIGRRRQLSDGYTTRDMADDYATAIDELDGTPDVLAVSMGGLIAQHLAADHSDHVRRLALGVTGCRIGEAGRRTLRRWTDWADRGWWFDVYLDTIPVTYTDYRRWLYPPFVKTIGRLLLPEPAASSDVAVSCRACLDHDTTDRLDEIEVPTLVIGGTEDHFFPVEIMRETADGIPDTRLELIDDTGHAAFEERKRAFDTTVRAFFDATTPQA